MTPTQARIYNNASTLGKKKTVISDDRRLLRNWYWLPLKAIARHYVAQAHGNQSKLADFCGQSPSQMHRYLCPICEHDQEPSFSIGYRMKRFFEINPITTDSDYEI